MGLETGVCITYVSLTLVPPPVLASSSYTYLKRRRGTEGADEGSREKERRCRMLTVPV